MDFVGFTTILDSRGSINYIKTEGLFRKLQFESMKLIATLSMTNDIDTIKAYQCHQRAEIDIYHLVAHQLLLAQSVNQIS